MTDSDYPVGFKKPPKHTQFKPGQSGNPKGRPRGVKNLATDLQEELEQFVVVHEGQETLKVTKQRAMLKSLFAKAMKGEIRASAALINLIIGLEQSRAHQPDETILQVEDLAILEAFKKRILSSSNEDTGEDQ